MSTTILSFWVQVSTAAHGWKAPLENSKACKVKVHCDGEILSCSDLIGARQQCQSHPGAIAVEMEGKGENHYQGFCGLASAVQGITIRS